MRMTIVMCLLFAVCPARADQAEPPCKTYFLGGQSNMEGFGFADRIPEEMRAVDERVLIFRGKTVLDGQPEGGIGTWDRLQPGFGLGFETDGKTNTLSDRFGPELSFGRAIADLNPGRCIAIIKYALGGSALSIGVGYGNWSPDYGRGQGVNQYDHALATIRNAFAARSNLAPAGIIWMQGEADAFDSEAAAVAYRANLERMMDLLRAALHSDGLPVVIGMITDSGMADDGMVMDYHVMVQQAQQSYANDDACATLVRDTQDYGYLDDAWHYDTDGYVAMGQAFARAVSELEKTCR